jgi:hypothetical protein
MIYRVRYDIKSYNYDIYMPSIATSKGHHKILAIHTIVILAKLFFFFKYKLSSVLKPLIHSFLTHKFTLRCAKPLFSIFHKVSIKKATFRLTLRCENVTTSQGT